MESLDDELGDEGVDKADSDEEKELKQVSKSRLSILDKLSRKMDVMDFAKFPTIGLDQDVPKSLAE